MNFEVQAERVQANMDPPAVVQTPSDQHLCYVRCNFCNTLLAVGIPCKRLLDTVTVKCGHCGNLSFLTIRASHPSDHPSLPPFQTTLSSDFTRGQSSSSSSSTSNEPTSPKAPFVVKQRRYNASRLRILKYLIEKLSALLRKT
ncbi:hypothetical protein R6Q57_013890 [Mikania cordata]